MLWGFLSFAHSKGDFIDGGPHNLLIARDDNIFLPFLRTSYVLMFHSVPELPSPSEVAYFTVEIDPGLSEQLKGLIVEEAKVMPRPPVQILQTDEKPGGVQVNWAEVGQKKD